MKIKKKFICLISVLTLVTGSLAGTAKAENTQYWPQGPEVVSSSAIVMEANTGTILYEKNIHDVHYPASITKILTTLLAIENSSMDEIVTFSEDSVFKTEGSGIARDVGEQMTMEQCLYAIMLASANECAYAVAEHVSGDIGTFINMMNERAAETGCMNTHFNNCNGLPDEQHYTSAYDMALLAREAYRNETFRIICGTKTYTIPFTNKHVDEETYLQNHHQMLYPLKTRKYLYDYCVGGKTGYTTVANNTLVTYAEKDGMTLICVVLDAPAAGHYEDSRALFDFCFDNFKLMNVSENDTFYMSEDKQGGGEFGSYEPFVELDKSGSVVLPVTAEFADAKSEVIYDEEDNDVLGNIQYTYAGRYVGGADIIATNASIDSFQFHNEKSSKDESSQTEESTQLSDQESMPEQKERVFQINLRVVFGAILVLALLACLILGLRKLIEDFYRIKRKLHLNRKPKSPYKEIKKNKMYRRRRHKRF